VHLDASVLERRGAGRDGGGQAEQQAEAKGGASSGLDQHGSWTRRERPAWLDPRRPRKTWAAGLTLGALPVFGPLRASAGGQVVEAGARGGEAREHLAGGAVALLGDDQLGDALRVGGLRVVVLVAVDEDDHVGVLLDGARLAQIGELGALVLGGARLHG